MNYLQMNLQFFSGEKTEKATPKKRQETRNKGQVAKSTDINTAIISLLVFLSFWLLGGFVREKITLFLQYMFQDFLLLELSRENVHLLFVELTLEAVIMVGPIMFIALVAGVASNYIQVGFLFSPEAIQMKLSKLNPIEGFKNIYSIRAIVELLKSLLKISLVGLVVYTILWLSIDQILSLALVPIADGLSFIGSMTVQIGIYVSILLLFLAVLDYIYQKYDHEKKSECQNKISKMSIRKQKVTH